MKKLLDFITEEVVQGFTAAGYDEKYAMVTLSNRPDLCEYQCNGALAAAKEYKKAPIMIANDVLAQLQDKEMFKDIEAVMPGFINIKISEAYVAEYLNQMNEDEHLSLEKAENPKTIIIDYGGPNIAKPLHVGHLRSAIIGESMKRIGKKMGHNVIGDVHLGDWGLQMGLIIQELKTRKPDLVYFDDSFEGEYPKEPPFTIAELEEIYPTASGKSKEDPEYKEAAMQATYLLQNGHAGYKAVWDHILNVSISDLKANYKKLDVEFELWKKESDAQPYIPEFIESVKASGLAKLDDGALIIDVKEESDTKEVPPCVILKSDGASLYTTTDLGTIIERQKLFQPDEIFYVVDKRQELHFEQIFRVVRKANLLPEETKLRFQGFGTMNGKDGKPFKTREGGVMRLEHLIEEINEEMFRKIVENHEVDEAEARETAKLVGLSAIKYGDLSNQPAKDYVFDIDRFTSFEGNTGPYILYTIVRIKSILNKYADQGGKTEATIRAACSDAEKSLMLELCKYNSVMESALAEMAPNRICAYIYDLANAFNRFYHGTKILSEEDKEKQAGWISLLQLTRQVLEECIDALGFTAPERM